MPEKSRVFEQTIKHKGFVKFSDFYNFCYQWFKDEGYDLAEEGYQEKLTDSGKEIKIRWKAKKKISDYFRNIIETRFETLGMVDVEIERDGKKEKTNKVVELRIDVTADLEKDYEKKWEDKPIWKFLRAVYDKYIIRTTVDEYEDRLTERTAKFVTEIKSYLQLEGK